MSNKGAIDVHAHVMPLSYLACLQRLGITPMRMPPPPAQLPKPVLPLAPISDSREDIAARIALMDDAGVATQLLSPTFASYLDDEAQAIEAARTVNDAIAAMVQAAPGRLAGYVSLPLPHVDAGLAEMVRGLDELGMAGVTMQCFCGDLSAADPMFEPLYAELNRRKAVLFLHPCVNGLCSRFLNEWKLTASAGPTFEDSVIAMHLMVSGIPIRYPDVKIIIPHLGGGLATLVARLDNQLPYFAELMAPPTVMARRMWYDTCCHGSHSAMRSAIESFGVDRLLSGSDYPVLTLHEPYRATIGFPSAIGLSSSEMEAILHRNARALFPKLVEGGPPTS